MLNTEGGLKQFTSSKTSAFHKNNSHHICPQPIERQKPWAGPIIPCYLIAK